MKIAVVWKILAKILYRRIKKIPLYVCVDQQTKEDLESCVSFECFEGFSVQTSGKIIPDTQKAILKKVISLSTVTS